MKIFIGSDHAGFALKQQLTLFLQEQGFQVEDKGPFVLNLADDYPDFVTAVVRDVQKGGQDVRGIVFGGSGQGEAMVANRFNGIRAVVFYGNPLDIIRLSREHNNANVLSLGARFLSFEEVKTAVTLWLSTNFSGDERHLRRLAKFDTIEG